MALSSSRLIFVLVFLIASASVNVVSAACTEKDQEVKTGQLSGLMTPLLQKDPPRAQKISEDMMSAMTLEGEAACAKLDELIARAK
jgi:hypothetical protein